MPTARSGTLGVTLSGGTMIDVPAPHQGPEYTGTPGFSLQALYEVTVGALPKGMYLAQKAVGTGTTNQWGWKGTPLQTGVFAFTVTNMGGGSAGGGGDYEWTIAASGSDFLCNIEGVARRIQPGWAIVESANNRNTFTFEIVSVNGSYRPEIDDEMFWFEEDVLIFAGLISSVLESGLQGEGIVPITRKCTALDWSALAERATVTSDIPAGTVKDALIVLVALLAPYGVTLNAAQVDGISLDALAYTDKPVKDALDDLAKLAGNWVWEINYYKELGLFEPSATAAPVDVVDGNGVALGDVTVEPSKTNSYANRIVVTFSAASSATVAYAFLRCTTGNFANTETVTIGSKTYTFQTVLTNTDGNVKVGATAEDSLSNLVAAVTLGAGSGTVYAAATTIHPDVTAYLGETDGIATLRCQANEPGAAGNSIGVSTTSTDGFWFGEGLQALTTLYRGEDLASLVNRVQADDVADQDIGGTGANLKIRTISRPDITSATVAQALADAELAASQATAASIVRYRTAERGLHPGQTQTITVSARALTGTHLITGVTIRNTFANRVERFVTTGEGTVLPRSWREVAQQMFSSTASSGSAPATVATPSGDMSGPSSSVAGEAALFDGTSGRQLKRATGTGVVHRTNGVDSASAVVEADITLADNTTNDVSTTKHGFVPKAPGDATKFLNGANPPAWTVPTAGAVNMDAQTVSTAETQAANTAYGDLATPGPSVTLTHVGTVAIIWLSALASRTGTGNSAFMGVALSGANTVAASDANAAAGSSSLSTGIVTLSRVLVLTGLTPGTTVFDSKFHNDGGATWTFSNRSMAVYAP